MKVNNRAPVLVDTLMSARAHKMIQFPLYIEKILSSSKSPSLKKSFVWILRLYKKSEVPRLDHFFVFRAELNIDIYCNSPMLACLPSFPGSLGLR